MRLATEHGGIKLEEAVRLLDRVTLEQVCKGLKLDYKKGRPSLIESIMKHTRQKNCFGSNIEKTVLKKYNLLNC